MSLPTHVFSARHEMSSCPSAYAAFLREQERIQGSPAKMLLAGVNSSPCSEC